MSAELARDDDDDELFLEEPAKLTLAFPAAPDPPLFLLPLRTDDALEIVDDVRINGNAAVSWTGDVETVCVVSAVVGASALLASENTGAVPAPGGPLTVEVEAEDSLCACVLRMDDEAGVVAMGVSFELEFPLPFDALYLVCSAVLPPTWVTVRRRVARGAVPTNAACVGPSANAEAGCLLDTGVGLGS